MPPLAAKVLLLPRKSKTREEMQVGVTGFEPATFCTPCRRASQVTLHPGELSKRQSRGKEVRRKGTAPTSFGRLEAVWQSLATFAMRLGGPMPYWAENSGQ